MKPLKVKISITLDGPILERIRTLAEADDRPISSYINQVLKAHLETLDRNKPTWDKIVPRGHKVPGGRFSFQELSSAVQSSSSFAEGPPPHSAARVAHPGGGRIEPRPYPCSSMAWP